MSRGPEQPHTAYWPIALVCGSTRLLILLLLICLCICDQPDNQTQILRSLRSSDITSNLRIVTISLALPLGGNPTAVNKILHRIKHHIHNIIHTLHLYVCLWHIAASNATKQRD